MRIVHALSLLLAVVLVMLAAGCGGGGGGITPPNDSNGAFTIDSGLEQVVYTPPASRQTYSVYAYFQNIASPQTVSALFAFDPFLNKWTLDYSSSSTQFNSQAIGTYDMTVWVIFSDDTENPKKVGNTVRMEDLSVYGATGPPPPPW